jgi:hypothetical protein
MLRQLARPVSSCPNAAEREMNINRACCSLSPPLARGQSPIRERVDLIPSPFPLAPRSCLPLDRESRVL